MAVDEPEFRTLLATLTSAEATAFVTDLWSARGWDVQRRADDLLVTPTSTTPTRRLAVLSPDSADDPGTTPPAIEGPTTDVDVAVATTDPERFDLPADVDVVGPGDLFQLLQFGVEPERGERLLANHFEELPPQVTIATESPTHESPGPGSPASSEPTVDSRTNSPVADAAENGAAEDGRGRAERLRGSPAGETSPDGSPPAERRDDGRSAQTEAGSVEIEAGSAETSTNTGESDADSTTDSPPAAAPAGSRLRSLARRTPSRRTLLLTGGAVVAGFGTAIATGVTTNAQPTVEAPGVTTEGVVDPAVLGDAHATGIAERSYSLSLDLAVSDATVSLRSYLSMGLELAADRRFRTAVATSGEDAPQFLGEPPAAAEFWADGETYLVNHAPAETDTFTEFQPPDGFIGTWKYWAWMIPFGGTLGSRPRDYFETVFDAVPTRLLDRQESPDGPRYRVVTDGHELASPSSLDEPGARDVREVSLDAVVDHRGVVEAFELGFAADLDGDAVEFTRSMEYTAFDETTVERPAGDG